MGFLVPVHDGTNPWYDSATQADPDAYKLGLGETYEACLLRHPDPELARAVARHLNKKPLATDAKYDIKSWGALTREITVETKKTDSGDQYIFKLSEKATDFMPPGPTRYDGWALYLDMPHATCGAVPAQIVDFVKPGDSVMAKYDEATKVATEVRLHKPVAK